MRTKTFFVTDAHLGSGADTRQREADLVRWLNAIEPEAKRVIMLGDIFDFWFTYKQAVPRGFVRLLGTMARMADSGIEFHFFIGNHDMWMFDYLEKEIGVTMHNNPEAMELEGKRFLSKVGISSLKLYASGYNLLTLFSPLAELDIDPEGNTAGWDNKYPNNRIYNFGINLTF